MGFCINKEYYSNRILDELITEQCLQLRIWIMPMKWYSAFNK